MATLIVSRDTITGFWITVEKFSILQDDAEDDAQLDFGRPNGLEGDSTSSSVVCAAI